mmetsp:Transcript_104826/g.333570  ORF Transcript_104826/g.333570 Transcript_104826/m.333570 type:complete len:232 (-) Transcript_104826:37-732(-)
MAGGLRLCGGGLNRGLGCGGWHGRHPLAAGSFCGPQQRFVGIRLGKDSNLGRSKRYPLVWCLCCSWCSCFGPRPAPRLCRVGPPDRRPSGWQLCRLHLHRPAGGSGSTQLVGLRSRPPHEGGFAAGSHGGATRWPRQLGSRGHTWDDTLVLGVGQHDWLGRSGQTWTDEVPPAGRGRPLPASAPPAGPPVERPCPEASRGWAVAAPAAAPATAERQLGGPTLNRTRAGWRS